MKKFLIPLALLLAFITSGCPPVGVHQSITSDVFKNGNYTTVVMPPGVHNNQFTNFIVIMTPTSPPPFACDKVDFTISFPQTDGTPQVITIISKRDGQLGAYSDHSNPLYTYVPSQGSATITACDSHGLPTGEPDTITVTTAPATESGVTNSPIQYPGPNTLGNDITIYSGPAGTTHLAQIQVMDEDYYGH